MKKQDVYDIIIVGAGASGLMAATAAKDANAGCEVLVLEKNAAAGKKLFATGNGRGNFLNRCAEPSDYFCRENPEGPGAFLSSVFKAAPVAFLEEKFRQLGIVAAQEEDGRLYPRSFQAKSIVEAFLESLRLRGVLIEFNAAVSGCRKEGAVFYLSLRDGREYKGRNVVLTTGGKAGCQYGSEGDGYKLAKGFGHSIIKPIPALTQIITEEDMQSLSGVRVGAGVSLWRSGGTEKTFAAGDSGEVQFAKEGVSGICVFNISRFLEFEEGVSYEIRVDAFEEYTEEQLLAMLLQRQRELSALPSAYVLHGLLPDRLCAEILKRSGVDAGASVGDVSLGTLRHVAHTCKAFSFCAAGTKSWRDSQVTAGGVSLREVSDTELQSTLQQGLSLRVKFWMWTAPAAVSTSGGRSRRATLREFVPRRSADAEYSGN